MNTKDYHDNIEYQQSDGWVFYNFRSTKFVFELYPDNENQQSVIDYINLFGRLENFIYRYILHDKDIKKDGSPTKPHYHLYLETDRRYTASKLLDKIGLDDNKWVMECDSKSAFLRYLIHYDNPDKHLYSIDSVHTNIDNFDELSIWRKPRKSKQSKILKELRGEDGLIECFNIIDNMFTCGRNPNINHIYRELLKAGLYNHMVGHRDIIYKYYEGVKYNR